jgi:2-dehydropantoate 2-reductase
MQEQSWPKIAVVGAGAIGCYFGAMLTRAGMAVTLVGRPGRVEAIRRNGLRFISGDRDERVPIAATTDIAAVGTARLVLFCVKSTDTDIAAAEMAPHLSADTVILNLQNGVDNAERIRAHTGNVVVPVLVYAAATMPETDTVKHTGGGNLVIGPGHDDIAALFTAAHVPIKVCGDIDVELWTKLVMNCSYNAVCALTGAPYGVRVANPEVRAVMIEAVNEVVVLAKAKGIRLPDDIADTAIRLADVMPQTMSSTAQDIAKGRPTEIDHLNGYVMREGARLGVATPVNTTLHALTKLLEQSKRAVIPGRREAANPESITRSIQ